MAATAPEQASIEARLDRIEASLERLTRLLDHAEAAVPMVADAADELVRDVQARGVDVDARVRSLGVLVDHVSEPHTAEALGAMVDQAPGLDTVVGLAAHADDHLAMGFDIADEWVRQADARGVNVHERLLQAADALEQLTEPATLGALTRIAAQADRLEWVTNLAASAEASTAMAFDALDELQRDAADAGFDVEALAHNTLQTARALGTPEAARARDALLDPALVDLLGTTVAAVESARVANPAPVGVWGALTALSDPKVGKAFAFLLAVARHLGEALEHPTALAPRR